MFPDGSIKLISGHDVATHFNKSGATERAFCGKCGTYMFANALQFKMQGSPFDHLDEPRPQTSPQMHVNYYAKRRPVTDGIVKFKDFPSPFGGSGDIMDDDGNVIGNDKQTKEEPPAISAPVFVIMGYGLAVGDAILEKLATNGWAVAIVARRLDVLQAKAAEWSGKANVKAFAGDLSKPETIAPLINRIKSEMGSIDVVLYNATSISVPNDVSIDQLISNVHINTTSLHATFNSTLPIFQAAGKGTFFTSGGGFGTNGAWAVPYGAQFGAGAKAYFRNFCQSAHATFKDKHIFVCNLNIQALVYGGVNITMQDPNPEQSNAFRKKLGEVILETINLNEEKWVDEVIISA